MHLFDKYIYGFHAITAALLAQPKHLVEIKLATSRDDVRAKQLMTLAEQHNIPISRTTAKDISDLLNGINSHQGVVAQVHGQMHFDEHDLFPLVEHHLQTSHALLLVMCDNIQDPHNLGAIMRSAEAFGAHAIITPKRNSAKLTPAARKVASGADASLPLIQVTNLSRCR